MCTDLCSLFSFLNECLVLFFKDSQCLLQLLCCFRVVFHLVEIDTPVHSSLVPVDPIFILRVINSLRFHYSPESMLLLD